MPRKYLPSTFLFLVLCIYSLYGLLLWCNTFQLIDNVIWLSILAVCMEFMFFCYLSADFSIIFFVQAYILFSFLAFRQFSPISAFFAFRQFFTYFLHFLIFSISSWCSKYSPVEGENSNIAFRSQISIYAWMSSQFHCYITANDTHRPSCIDD